MIRFLAPVLLLWVASTSSPFLASAFQMLPINIQTPPASSYSSRSISELSKPPNSPSSLFMSFDVPSGNFFDEVESSDEEKGEESEFSDLPTEALTDEEFEEHIPKINSVTLVGRIGQDPEPRYFDDGKVVLRLGLAVKRKYHPLERQAKEIKTGEEETDWFNLELWGRDAEYAAKYVTKGARVGITGSLNMDSWIDRLTEEERTSCKIVVRQLDILETRAEAELRKGNQGGGNYSGNSNYGGGNSGSDYGDGPSSGGSGGFFDN